MGKYALCDKHADMMLHELRTRGLFFLFPENEAEHAHRIRNGIYNPLSAAYNAVLVNSAKRLGEKFQNEGGCGICLVGDESWPAIAAVEQVAFAKHTVLSYNVPRIVRVFRWFRDKAFNR